VRSVHQEAAAALAEADAFWSDWSRRFKPIGEWSQAVIGSLLTLKALSHRETGGIVAAGTTRGRCRKKIGGNRNWDYRFCWLRDATFTLLRRRKRGAGGYCAPSPAVPKICRSCTVSPASAVSWNTRCPGCQVMRVFAGPDRQRRGRAGSA
jgi:hypothetical protein